MFIAPWNYLIYRELPPVYLQDISHSHFKIINEYFLKQPTIYKIVICDITVPNFILKLFLKAQNMRGRVMQQRPASWADPTDVISLTGYCEALIPTRLFYIPWTTSWFWYYKNSNFFLITFFYCCIKMFGWKVNVFTSRYQPC